MLTEAHAQPWVTHSAHKAACPSVMASRRETSVLMWAHLMMSNAWGWLMRCAALLSLARAASQTLCAVQDLHGQQALDTVTAQAELPDLVGALLDPSVNVTISKIDSLSMLCRSRGCTCKCEEGMHPVCR